MDPKFGTWKVFATRKPILASDFDNFQISVNYNALSSGQRLSKILKINMKVEYSSINWLISIRNQEVVIDTDQRSDVGVHVVWSQHKNR